MKTCLSNYHLNSGQEICLDALRIDHTYCSHVMGKIGRRTNEFSLNLHKILLMQAWPGLPSVILNLEALNAKMDDVLPVFHCMGIFSCFFKEDPVTGHLPARFCAVWFQDQFPPIISSENERLLLELDFDKVMRSERGPISGSGSQKKSLFSLFGL